MSRTYINDRDINLTIEEKMNESMRQLKSNNQREQKLKLEKELFLQAVQEQHLHIHDLFIDQMNYIHHIEIDKVKRTDRNHLVLLHGFGSGAFTYFKMVEILQDYFFLTLIEIPGQAFNSRSPQLENIQTVEGWINYFLNTLYQFFQSKGYKKFMLAGHSMGGYICGHYFGRFSSQIQILYLLSPAGFSDYSEDYEKMKEKVKKKQGWMRRIALSCFKSKINEDKKSPYEYYKYPLGGPFIKRYLGGDKFTYSPEEKYRIKEILRYFFKQPQYGERAVSYLLKGAVKSDKPIFDAIRDIKARHRDIHIMYGDEDWMDKGSTKKKMKENNLEITIDTINNSSHQVESHNPSQVCEIILHYYNERIKNAQMSWTQL